MQIHGDPAEMIFNVNEGKAHFHSLRKIVEARRFKKTNIFLFEQIVHFVGLLITIISLFHRPLPRQ